MTLLRVYQGAQGPTGGPTPGALALMAWYLGQYGSRGGRNLGIYNPKRIAGAGSAWSLHAEGRADDLGVPGGDPSWANTLASALMDNSGELGVQLVIYRREVWSAAHPDSGRRRYDGSNPHTDHLHVELSWSAARTATSALFARYLPGPDRTPPPPPPPPIAHAGIGGRTLYLAWPQMRGPDVRWVQRFIGPSECGADDGVYGPHTVQGVRWYQRMRGVHEDGRVGPVTWGQMGVTWHG